MQTPDNHSRYREDDEIDLLEIIGIFWFYRYLIIGVTFLSLLFGAFYAFTREEQTHDSAKSDYHFKAMASLYFSKDPITEETMGFASQRVLNSTSVYEAIVSEFDLFDSKHYENLEEMSQIEKREAFEKLADISFSDRSGILNVSFLHPDQEIAVTVVSKMLELLETRLLVLDSSAGYSLIDEASIVGGERVRVKETQPTRKRLYLTLSLIIGVMFSSFLAIILNFSRRIKNDPEALKKIQGF